MTRYDSNKTIKKFQVSVDIFALTILCISVGFGIFTLASGQMNGLIGFVAIPFILLYFLTTANGAD